MTSQAEDLMSGVNPRKNGKTGLIRFQVKYFDGNLQNEQLNKRKVYSRTLPDPQPTGPRLEQKKTQRIRGARKPLVN